MRRKPRCSTLFAGFLILLCIASAASQSKTVDWAIAATGDAAVTRRFQVAPEDEGLSKLRTVFHNADVTFANLEFSLLNLQDFGGYPQAENGGNNAFGPIGAAQDLRELGIKMVGRANNHSTDFGVEGMLYTDKVLDVAGLIHAGSGSTLGEARAASYLDTPKGRFALIALATSATPMSRAANPTNEMRGRPGISTLRLDVSTQVSRDTFKQIAALAQQLGLQAQPGATAITLRGAAGPNLRFVIGDHSGEPTFDMNKGDVDDIFRYIRSAKAQADYVIVSIHAHQQGTTEDSIPDFLPKLARAAIDAGADIFVTHGPNVIRGFEVYKGKAVYYGVGRLFFENQTVEPVANESYERDNIAVTTAGEFYNHRFPLQAQAMTREDYWEGILPVARYRGEQVQEIQFVPTDLGQQLSRAQRGVARVAEGEKAMKILSRFVRLSGAFGKQLTIQNGVAVWKASGPLQ